MLLKNGVTALVKATERVPMTTSSATFKGAGLTFGEDTSKATQLSQMQAGPWTFAVISRIVQSLSAIEWTLWNGRRKDDRSALPDDHPALRLWERPNAFSDMIDFIETFQQHMELTGEAYWLVARDRSGLGIPQELWVLRPDYIRPIPDPEAYISGWIYKIGMEEFRLEPEDVIQLKFPDPKNPYGGLGPLQAMMRDVETEAAATLFQRNFFKNDATPGGVLEFEEGLSDPDYERISARWNRHHQGVANSHRVAIIEMGKWVDRKISQRDMEFERLRKLGRDTILGGFGVPKSVMGISEDINRSNAEAGELIFARYVLQPRLRRIRAALNEFIAPMFGENLYFDFDNPVEEDRTLLLEEATSGHRAGVLTKNEARRRLGEEKLEDEEAGSAVAGLAFPAPEVQSSDRLFTAGILTLNEARDMNGLEGIGPDGDTFAKATTDAGEGDQGDISGELQESDPAQQPPPPDPAQVALDLAVADELKTPALLLGRDVNDPDDLWPASVEAAENDMERAWSTRLANEVEALVAYIAERNKSASVGVGGTKMWTKIGPDDASGYDWNWNAKYLNEVIAEISAAFEVAALAEGMSGGVTGELAANYAIGRSETLIQGISEVTRDAVNELVAQAVDNGQSLGELQRTLRDHHGFSAKRARMIARTETSTALGEAAEQHAIEQGRDEKHWRTQGIDVDGGDADGPCVLNEGQGWVRRVDSFTSGHMKNPAHPNCRCVVSYRTAMKKSAKVYCPNCTRRLAISAIVDDLEIYCGKCGKQFAERGGVLVDVS
jgi:HK97 family phage portal protein